MKVQSLKWNEFNFWWFLSDSQTEPTNAAVADPSLVNDDQVFSTSVKNTTAYICVLRVPSSGENNVNLHLKSVEPAPSGWLDTVLYTGTAWPN